jgi:hypothetical protein
MKLCASPHTVEVCGPTTKGGGYDAIKGTFALAWGHQDRLIDQRHNAQELLI